MGSNNIVPEIEKNYIGSILKKGKRIDGRALDEFREIVIECDVIKRAEASARIRLGDTRLLLGIKVSAGPPYPDTPESGVITVNSELLPLASARFESGPPSAFAIEVARVCDRGIRHSNLIDKKNLCIIPGEKVFVLFADMYAISFDGNLFDAGELALTTALSTLKIPEYDIVENQDGSKDANFKDVWRKLDINDVPVSVTIGKIGNVLFVDPNEKEELALDARLTFTYNKNDDLISLQKGLSGDFTKNEVTEGFELALKKADNLRNVIREAIKPFQ